MYVIICKYVHSFIQDIWFGAGVLRDRPPRGSGGARARGLAADNNHNIVISISISVSISITSSIITSRLSMISGGARARGLAASASLRSISEISCFLGGRDPGTLKSDIVSKQHPQLICSDLRLSNWKFEDWNYGNRPYRYHGRYFCTVKTKNCNSFPDRIRIWCISVQFPGPNTVIMADDIKHRNKQ